MTRKKRTTGGKARGAPRRGQTSPKAPPTFTNSKGSGRAQHNSFAHEPSGPSFTLKDAARGTTFRSTQWGSQNLRHKGIGFVKSTDPTAFQPKDVLEADVELSSAEPSPPKSPSEPVAEPPSTWTSRAVTHGPEVQVSSETPPSPAGSSSSEEVVVFTGRGKNPQLTAGTAVDNDTRQRGDGKVETATTEQELARPAIVKVTTIDEVQEHDYDVDKLIQRTKQHTLSPLPSHHQKNKAAHKFPGSRAPLADRDHEAADHSEEALADYVANLKESGVLDNGIETTPDLGTTSDRDGWRTSDIEDFRDLSTSEEVLPAVQAVLSKRTRPSGLQYLVVWEGHTVDEARWVLQSALTMDGAAELIQKFEEKLKLKNEYLAEDDSDSSEEGGLASYADYDSDDDEEDDDDEDEDFDDERDLVERRMARLSDEKIARLLAKQEELGMGSDQLFIFDGDLDSVDDDEGAEKTLDDLLRPSRRKSARNKGKNQARFIIPEDDLDGDNYGDFDVMDHERPSLMRASKRGKDPFDGLTLSDSDLEATLRSQWTADRKKKRIQKKEREELRAQGLLGKKHKDKPDLEQKYTEGMSIDQLRDTLHDFLLGTDDSCALPPLDKQDRKIIHEIAHQFGLKSQSRGKGRSRFPVLFKTSRSVEFDDDVFNRLQQQLSRRYLPRMDKKARKSSGGFMSSRRGRGPVDAGYMDGEIVGAGAAEIAATNRGRAMLEKMGWSTGTALGAGDNKGILLPIEHVVKKSKAGLG